MKTATEARSDTAAGGTDVGGGGSLFSLPTTKSLSSLLLLLSTMTGRFLRELRAFSASWSGALGCFEVLSLVGGFLGKRRSRRDVSQQLVEGDHQNGKTSFISAYHPRTTNKETTTHQLTLCGCGERSEWIRLLLITIFSRHCPRSNC
jgi:hypothetical protein